VLLLPLLLVLLLLHTMQCNAWLCFNVPGSTASRTNHLPCYPLRSMILMNKVYMQSS
jgi:hypothetical protein